MSAQMKLSKSIIKNNRDKRLKARALKEKEYGVIDIDKELNYINDFFKQKVPVLKDVITQVVKFNKARKKKTMNDQIKIWNDLLSKFIEFDLAFEVTGEKIRKISHELVHEAEVKHMKSDIFRNIEEKSESI